MQLHEINFPIYKLGNTGPIQHETIAFYLYVDDTDQSKPPQDVYLIVDDKAVAGHNLGMRRLQLQSQGVQLYKLNKAIFFIQDMLKLAVGATWFIDSLGKIFEYKKTKKVPLIYKPIKKIIPVLTGGAVLEVEGIAHRFKTLYMPRLEERYAGLLKINRGYLLYGLYDKLYTATTRMI